MRRFHSNSRSGFTLVELLVVIAIIAILASVVAVAGNAALTAGKRGKMGAIGSQLQTAVLNYYTEYGTYPVDTSAGPVSVDTFYGTGSDWQRVTLILTAGIDLGNPSAAAQQTSNTRQLSYLSLTRQDLDTTLKPAVPKTPFKDSRGNAQYFQMAMDSDYSNILGDTGGGSTMPPDFSVAKSSDTSLPGGKEIAAGVAVWANGDPSSTGTKTHPTLWTHTY